jgi:hypothetical protein
MELETIKGSLPPDGLGAASVEKFLVKEQALMVDGSRRRKTIMKIKVKFFSKLVT